MRKLVLICAFAGALAAPAQAVIIQDSTWAENGGTEENPAGGFGAHVALANEPQFDAAVLLERPNGMCSGTWIGNFDGAGYVLTAAHCLSVSYPRPPRPEDLQGDWRTKGGGSYKTTANWPHPYSIMPHLGYDLVIVRLDRPVEDAGPQPLLYAGKAEMGRLGVMVGFGARRPLGCDGGLRGPRHRLHWRGGSL